MEPLFQRPWHASMSPRSLRGIISSKKDPQWIDCVPVISTRYRVHLPLTSKASFYASCNERGCLAALLNKLQRLHSFLKESLSKEVKDEHAWISTKRESNNTSSDIQIASLTDRV